jgi:hypothetical protein
VAAAAGAVEAAVRDAGFAAGRRDQSAGLADVFPGMGEGLAEWVVTAADGAQMMLQMAHFDRGRDPVVTDIGAVLDLEDVAGGKVCALAGRVEPRDYADTAAMLHRFSPGQLLGFARRLDQLPDQVLAAIGLSRQDVAVIRQRFTTWPRTPEGRRPRTRRRITRRRAARTHAVARRPWRSTRTCDHVLQY